MTYEIERNSSRTFLQVTRGKLKLHVGATGLSRVSRTVGGSALYAGRNIGIEPSERFTEDLPSDPSTEGLGSQNVTEERSTPIINDILARLTGLPARSFSIMKAWSSRSSQSKTTRASRNS